MAVDITMHLILGEVRRLIAPYGWIAHVKVQCVSKEYRPLKISTAECTASENAKIQVNVQGVSKEYWPLKKEYRNVPL
jgi:hypothetical protein